MKKNHIYRYRTLTACSIIFASFMGLGISGPDNRFSHNPGEAVSVGTTFSMSDNIVKTGIPAKSFYSVLVDSQNTKWFLTELGIISFSGDKWTIHNENVKIGSSNLKDFAYRNNPGGPELWVVSPNGATVTTLPFDEKTEATTFLAGDSSILSSNVTKVTFGNGPL